jgi:hypothetical protein
MRLFRVLLLLLLLPTPALASEIHIAGGEDGWVEFTPDYFELWTPIDTVAWKKGWDYGRTKSVTGELYIWACCGRTYQKGVYDYGEALMELDLKWQGGSGRLTYTFPAFTFDTFAGGPLEGEWAYLDGFSDMSDGATTVTPELKKLLGGMPSPLYFNWWADSFSDHPPQDDTFMRSRIYQHKQQRLVVAVPAPPASLLLLAAGMAFGLRRRYLA